MKSIKEQHEEEQREAVLRNFKQMLDSAKRNHEKQIARINRRHAIMLVIVLIASALVIFSPLVALLFR